MQQIERLVSRLVQLAEDCKGQHITLSFIVDNQGNIVAWYVNQSRLEGLNSSIIKETSEADKPARKKSSDTKG